MRILVFSFMMLVGTQVWGSDTLLNCQFAKKGSIVSFNVSSLLSDGCKDQTFSSSTEGVQSRYLIAICNRTEAHGVMEVLTTAGDWVEVREFSNQKNGECILKEEFKPIRTNYPCRPTRFGHSGGCLE